VKHIRELLFFQPVEKPIKIRGQWKKPNSSTPILFYQKVEKDGETYVFLPYYFAQVLFSKNLALDRHYITADTQFIGKLRDYQAVEVPIMLEHLDTYGTTTLRLHPGWGKTAISAYLSCHYKLITVVIMHRTHLIKQWCKTFEKFTNAKCWVVGEDSQPPPIFNVIVCLDKRVMKIPEEMRIRVGFMVIDEAHAFCTATQVPRLLGFHPRYVVACTATLEKDNKMHRMIEAICGKHHIYRELKKDFHVYMVKTGIKAERQTKTGGGGINWHVLAQSLANNPVRNRMIVEMARKNLKHKIVILTGYKSHTKELYRMFKELGESVDYLCGNLKKYKDSRILIGTISKIGTGFDEENFCDDFNGVKINLGILTHSIANKQILEQSVGRVFRADFPNIMHLVDDDRTIERHWKTARAWYRSKGGIINEVNLTNFKPFNYTEPKDENDSVDLAVALKT
jgi:hypothetical protein